MGRVDRAFELHEGLRGLGLRADMDTYISLLALAHRHSSPLPEEVADEDGGQGKLIGRWCPDRCGDYERVRKLWTMITLAGIEPNTRLVNSFIANCNSPERALIAFNKYASPSPSPSPRSVAPQIYRC